MEGWRTLADTAAASAGAATAGLIGLVSRSICACMVWMSMVFLASSTAWNFMKVSMAALNPAIGSAVEAGAVRATTLSAVVMTFSKNAMGSCALAVASEARW